MTHNKRYEELPTFDKKEHLRALYAMRRACMQAQTKLAPLGSEYQRLGIFVSMIDMHQQHYSGEFNYMHAGGNAARDLF